jgi:hypothetical protein
MKKSFYLFIVVTFFISACSSIVTSRKQKAPFIKNFYNGQTQKAEKSLQAKANAYQGTIDELTWELEVASTLFETGNFELSLEAFNKCERSIKDYESRAVVSGRETGLEGTVLLTNLNALPYKGKDIDKTMLFAYKALNYFALNKKESALVEIRRMREVQKEIIKNHQDILNKSKKDIENINRLNQKKAYSFGQGSKNTNISFEKIKNNKTIKQTYKPTNRFSNKLFRDLGNPFISYLSAIGYLIEQNYNEALLDFRNLYEMKPNSKLIQKYLVTCAKSIGATIPDELSDVKPFEYPLDRNIAFILFFNGRGAALKSKTFQIILPIVGYTGIAFPDYEEFKRPLPKLYFEVNKNNEIYKFSTEKLVDLDAVKLQEYQDNFPLMMTRIVASTLTKELASFAAVYAAKQAGSGVGIAALALTGFYKYLFNIADTRCWETLPKEIQIGHFQYPKDGIIKIDSNESSNALQKSKVFQLQKNTKVSIIYIRALNKKNIIYRIFELD